MAVRYYTDDCTYRLPQKRLTAVWLDRVAREEGYELGDVTYITRGDGDEQPQEKQHIVYKDHGYMDFIRFCGRQFLGHDCYTDVITFDYSDRKGARIVSGDIFIDVETVADNAREYGAAKLTEMRRVVVHGLLHLCGQKDKTPRANAQMHRKEDRYLRQWDELSKGLK